MVLSWNEIRNRATSFSRRWREEKSEQASAQSFWNEFFHVFGLDRKRVAVYEKQVKIARAGGKLKHGRIDAFWKGKLLIEHKSKGADLDGAFKQAVDYFDGISEQDLPRYILVSDFERLRLYDLETDAKVEFCLEELHRYIKYFSFMAGYQPQVIESQDPVNIKAAELMGKLHDTLEANGYAGHQLEVLLVRFLFCFFAEDTGIFQPADAFLRWLKERTSPDGSDLGMQLTGLFQVLNTPKRKRQKNLDEQLVAFPYINGALFDESLLVASFDAFTRAALLNCAALDWSTVSPSIFGAMFQSTMNEEARRNLGAHYTSEENILKLIKPLFLDALWEEFEQVREDKDKLREFHEKLRSLTFFDPACGCGNFLVVTYRELRKLELEVLGMRYAYALQAFDETFSPCNFVSINVDQFYGIEIEEFPVQIAQVALWLVDHQMNLRVSKMFGKHFVRIPLKTMSHIHHGNALTMDWNNVLPAKQANYVLGNPPFVGAKVMDTDQRRETKAVFQSIKNSGLLDYVAAWYVKAAKYIKTSTRCAFVSTSSITQGEQVGILWPWLFARGIHVHFAHQTFKWSNEAKGVAAVHCVIIGFGKSDVQNKVIYEYVAGSIPHAVSVSRINPYLVDAADVVLIRRSKSISVVPEIGIGNKPIDDGNYLFTTEERDEFLNKEPKAAKYFRRWLGTREFINGYERWCLWLGDCSLEELRRMPEVMARVKAVETFRRDSKSAPTKKLAGTPTRFHVENMPRTSYLVIPEVSSERRHFIPIGFESPETLCSNKLRIAPGAGIYHFGILTSTMHNAWMRYVGGRLGNGYSYSIKIVYNNFPWPENFSDVKRKRIEAAAQAVLDTRAQFPNASLADLYDPLVTPLELVKAHRKLDRAVDSAYGKRSFQTESERVAFLFELYAKYTENE